MPLYEFLCLCGYRCTHILPVSDRDTRLVCLGCGREMRRQISAPAIQFRGSGFYVTDSRQNKD